VTRVAGQKRGPAAAAEASLAENLAAETERAQSAESANAAAIATEATRAVGAEAGLLPKTRGDETGVSSFFHAEPSTGGEGGYRCENAEFAAFAGANGDGGAPGVLLCAKKKDGSQCARILLGNCLQGGQLGAYYRKDGAGVPTSADEVATVGQTQAIAGGTSRYRGLILWCADTDATFEAVRDSVAPNAGDMFDVMEGETYRWDGAAWAAVDDAEDGDQPGDYSYADCK
jgi:hypothetical protein